MINSKKLIIQAISEIDSLSFEEIEKVIKKIDLEEVERIDCELAKLLQPVVDLAMKNKKILYKYDKKE